MADDTDRITALEINQAVQAEQLKTLTQVVSDNTEAINALTAALNRGQGAGWVMGGILTIVLALVAGLDTIVDFFTGDK